MLIRHVRVTVADRPKCALHYVLRRLSVETQLQYTVAVLYHFTRNHTAGSVGQTCARHHIIEVKVISRAGTIGALYAYFKAVVVIANVKIRIRHNQRGR